MSDIIITEKNLSRFNKRLQKALSNHLKQDIPLHLASLLFAQALGVDTVHHLQEKLLEPVKKENECQQLQDFIEHYFLIHPESQLLSFYFFLDNNYLALSIDAKSKKLNSEEGFSIFFGSEPSYLDTELNRLSLSEKDISFIHELVSLLHFDDLPLNIYLAEKLKLHFKLESNSIYDFKLNKEFESVNNYGFCEKLYALVDIDFFERKGASYVLHNDKYVFIDLEHEQFQLFKSFSEAKLLIDDKHMLVEFLTPIHQFSTLISPSKHKVQGISSHYVYKENNELIGLTSNNQFQHIIHNDNDFHFFLGKSFYNIFRDKSFLTHKIAINNPYRLEVLSGFDSCIPKKEIKTKNHK